MFKFLFKNLNCVLTVNIAVPLAAGAVFSLSGQICIAASRLFVQSGIYDEFVKRAVQHAKGIKVGPPTAPDTQQGPQVNVQLVKQNIS